MNKKGFFRTLEAVIAIVVILTFIYSVAPKKEIKEEIPYALKTARDYILNEIATNPDLRNLVTESSIDDDVKNIEDIGDLDEFIKNNIPPGYEYSGAICKTTYCVLEEKLPEKKTIYMADIIVSPSSLEEEPRIVRLWFWRKG